MKKFVSAISAISAVTMIAPMSAMAQVTSVGQLRDVQPTEWSYQAVSSLVSRYGCVAGFPGGTFRPGEPATRAQLATLTNSCLDRISEFQTAADAQLAFALRAQFSKGLNATNARVALIEKAAVQKAQGIGNYVGAGVLLDQQGVAGNGFSANKTVGAFNAQGRYVFTQGFNGEFSARPYLNVVAGPNSQLGASGGLLATYDYSIAKRAGVSAVNVYAGAGYQVPFTQYGSANYQSAVGNRGQVVLALGVEGRLSDSLVGYSQLTFPTTNASNSYGATNGTYSPVLTAGLGIKF